MKVLRWLVLQIFNILGWRLVGSIPPNTKKAVVVVAPHTSNWDGFYGLLFCFVKQLPIKFAIKKEAMFFPLGPILRCMGALPIDRSSHKITVTSGHTVQRMVYMLQQQASLFLIIAPEGTRSRVKRWKKGFYQIAIQAKVPILLGYMDYQQKHIGLGPVFYPTGDFDKDILQIQAFYKDKAGKYPSQSLL